MAAAWLTSTLIGASVLGAAVYGLYYLRRPVAPGPVLARTLVKTLAVGAMAAFAAAMGGPVLLVAALALSAVGDACLAGKGEARFLAGLIAFLLAHAAYAPLFLALGAGLGPVGDAPWRWAPIVGLTLCAALMLAWLWSGLGAMRAPVVAYFAVIAIMGASAWALPENLGPAWLVIALGATAFMTSDAILGAEIFRLAPDARARAWTPHAVWWLYWLGQGAITAGVLWALGLV